LIVRRLPITGVVVAGIAALVAGTAGDAGVVDSVFSRAAVPWMPAAPPPGGLTSTWYCPGVPASPDGDDERPGGLVAVFNPEDEAMTGTITLLTEADGDPTVQSFNIPAFSSHSVDVDELVDSPYAAAVVEIEGGGGLVEQQATWPVGTNSVGDSVSPCANTPSAQWYFATGDTSEGSRDLLVLSNPHDYSAVIDITLSTSRGPRQIERFAVPAKSVRTIDLRDHTVNDEVDVGVTITASRGALVAARAQTYETDTRGGYSMVLGATAARDQWWFAAGERADDIEVEYSIYNPGPDEVTVNAVMLGFLPARDVAVVQPEPVVVPPGRVEVVTLEDAAGIPDGPVSAVFATDGALVVVERTLTRTISGIRTTSVTPGATSRSDDFYLANTWYLGLGPEVATEDGLQLYNIDRTDGVITIQAVTGDGIVTLDGLDAIDIGPNETLRLDITEEMLGRQLIIRSTTRLLAERVLPRETGAQGRVASWLLPAM